jgi:nitrogen fixation NifU-like protein
MTDPDLRSLYQEVILDHYRQPRNFGLLADANRAAEGYNPLCGDQVSLRLRVEDDRIAGIAFQGQGCAISTASASLMTEAVAGMTREEALALQRRFHHLLTDAQDNPGSDLGKLEALKGVRDYPVRIKCATLAWHALRRALEERPEAKPPGTAMSPGTAPVSTE